MCPKPKCKKENIKLPPGDRYLSKLQLDDSGCRRAAAEFLIKVFKSSESSNSNHSEDSEEEKEEESEGTESDTQ